MSYYDSSNSFINKLNNLKLRNFSYFETNKKTIDRPREKYNSFVENGNRILSKFDGLQNKNTNQNPYMKDKPFFQSQNFLAQIIYYLKEMIIILLIKIVKGKKQEKISLIIILIKINIILGILMIRKINIILEILMLRIKMILITMNIMKSVKC